MADYITFEMTESAVLSTEPHFLERLLRLRMKGFGLAIDDYGTGRSNLQLLARIPFSELKIDRSFVDGASKRAAIGTVLRSCLGLARRSNLSRWASRPSRTGTSCKAWAAPMPRLLHRQADAGRRIPRWLADWQHFF
jgi:EAL domain-containing protein (putative c-di-GMP-specific phosphodiesterase class I)